MVPSHPAELVNTTGPRTQSRVMRDIWLTPRALGPGSESPGTAGRPRRHSITGPSTPGCLVNTEVPSTGSQFAQDSR